MKRIIPLTLLLVMVWAILMLVFYLIFEVMVFSSKFFEMVWGGWRIGVIRVFLGGGIILLWLYVWRWLTFRYFRWTIRKRS